MQWQTPFILSRPRREPQRGSEQVYSISFRLKDTQSFRVCSYSCMSTALSWTNPRLKIVEKTLESYDSGSSLTGGITLRLPEALNVCWPEEKSLCGQMWNVDSDHLDENENREHVSITIGSTQALCYPKKKFLIWAVLVQSPKLHGFKDLRPGV